MAAGATSSHPNPRIARLKGLAFYANYVVTIAIVLLLVAGICLWIYEEVAMRVVYLPKVFLDNDPKMREGRMILLIGYLLTLAFLSMIQCCIQIAKDPHHGHIGPRRMVWAIAATLMILIFIGAAGLAASYKSNTLPRLEEKMTNNLTGEPYYSDYSSGNFSDIGKLFNKIQSGQKCCGVNGRADYATFRADYSIPIPYSCCKLKDGSSPGEVINDDDVEDYATCSKDNDTSMGFTRGCHKVLHDPSMSMSKEIVIIAAIAAIVIFVVAVLRLSLGYWYQSMKKKEHYQSIVEKGESKKQDENGPASDGPDKDDTEL